MILISRDEVHYATRSCSVEPGRVVLADAFRSGGKRVTGSVPLALGAKLAGHRRRCDATLFCFPCHSSCAEAMRSSVRTGILRLALRSYAAKPGIISTILAYSWLRSGSAVEEARTWKRSAPTSTVATGLASRFRYQSGGWARLL